jgi:integrase
MPSKKAKTWRARVYIGRDQDGRQQFHYIGRFATKRERDNAVAHAIVDRPWEAKPAMTCGHWCERYLERFARRHKASSLGTARQSLKRFRADFGDRPIDQLEPVEAEDWVQTVPRSAVPHVISMFNYAVKMRAVVHNPFAGLGCKGRGRADKNPPTVAELERLLDGCDALGDYAPQMRAIVIFAAYTGMRPGELFELRWSDIDLAANRIHVSRRLYRGAVDTPKSGRSKTIALPPPARDVLMRQPTRALELVFVSKWGMQLTASNFEKYWNAVRTRAGLQFEFYLATKHYGVHLLYRLSLSQRAIAAQMGWSEKSVEDLLRTYGHADLVALAEVDQLYLSDLSDPNSDPISPDRQ